jgi:hypothetical protein
MERLLESASETMGARLSDIDAATALPETSAAWL